MLIAALQQYTLRQVSSICWAAMNSPSDETCHEVLSDQANCVYLLGLQLWQRILWAAVGAHSCP